MLRELIDSRLASARRAASEAVDGLNDRSELFVAEFGQERQRLFTLVMFGVATLVVCVVALVWAAASLVALAWDTAWRTHALIGMMAFWVLLALALGLRVRRLLTLGSDAFKLTRRVVAEDYERLKEKLRS